MHKHLQKRCFWLDIGHKLFVFNLLCSVLDIEQYFRLGDLSPCLRRGFRGGAEYYAFLFEAKH